MAKRQKLTLQQKRRVAKSQQKKRTQATPTIDEDHLGDMQEGIVISRFGEQADVARADQSVARVYLRQNLGSCVSGDRVSFRLDSNEQGVIEVIHPRHSELKRPTPHAGIKTIVANVDQIFVVVAPLPDYSSLILDRYLIACELAEISTSIILNKTDLLSEEQKEYFAEQMSIYQSIGYRTLSLSAKNESSLNELKRIMSDKENIFVGQSGVGKSSLINQLLPDAEAVTGEVSSNSRLGTHTTTASRLYFLSEGGHIIDSPGVREFGLSHMEPDDIINGYREFSPFLGLCKFRNCLHRNEKGCAIIRAAEENQIHAQRLENYQKIYSQITG